jgi:hypothetical protein
MSTLRLCHRSENYKTQGTITVPDGEHEWVILVDNCEFCGKIYNVEKTTDRFCSGECQEKYRNRQRRKDPSRPYKKRKALKPTG